MMMVQQVYTYRMVGYIDDGIDVLVLLRVLLFEKGYSWMLRKELVVEVDDESKVDEEDKGAAKRRFWWWWWFK